MILEAVATYLSSHMRHFRATATDDQSENHIYIRPKFNNNILRTLHLQDATIHWQTDVGPRYYDLTDPDSLDQIATQLDKDLKHHLGFRHWQ